MKVMASSVHLNVDVDLSRIVENVRAIQQKVAVHVLPVIKADAYGLGAWQVASALADVVEGFCIFSLTESHMIELHTLTEKQALVLGPPSSTDPDWYLRYRMRPAVTTVDQALTLRRANPVLCVDTGMQRFACPTDRIDAVIEAGDIKEAFTHATRVEHAERLVELLGGRGLTLHAAATALLDEPRAYLDAVRPGWAIYRNAVRVTTPLVETHDASGPAGYSSFTTTSGRHGIILAGYSNGIRPGPCLVNGARQRIVEVGMQSAFVEIGRNDTVGAEVVLLGEELSESEIAAAWGTSPQEALLQLARSGRRKYRD
jgi:alanine racemase